MAVSMLIVSCFLFYLTSKHFPLPEKKLKKIATQKLNLNILAMVLAVTSLMLFLVQFNWVTMLVMWLTTLTTSLSGVILSIKLNIMWVYLWSLLALLFLAIDFS